MAWKLRIQTVTGPMAIPTEVDLIFKMGYKLRGKKEQEEEWKGGGNLCALRAGKAKEPAMGTECSVIGQRGCQDVMLDRGLLGSA